MNLKKMFRKGQSLPLNTVVISILVILVLVIIIFYFTTSMSENGNAIEENTKGVNGCEVGSYIIDADKYSHADYIEGHLDNEDENINGKKKCDTSANWVRIYGAKDDANGNVCCAKKKSN